MTTSSVADIDQFIRAQKEKLLRDKQSDFGPQYYDNNANFDPNQFVDVNQYRRPNAGPPPNYIPPNQTSPRLALKQAHPSPSIYVPLDEQPAVQADRITKKYPEQVFGLEETLKIKSF